MSEELRLPGHVAQDMIAHCQEERPNEACGLLATKDGAVVDVLRMSNAAASPVRYALDPQEQFVAYRAIEKKGLELGGVFHSHTRTEAYPSPTDVRLASEDVPYLIVSLAAEPPAIRAFRIVKENWTDEDGEITEIPLVVGD
jgi:proteasome lid subunit RPN8/RPN11